MTISGRTRTKLGLVALSTAAVFRACCSVISQPPSPGITYSDSSKPASIAFLPASIISCDVAPFLTRASTSSSPLSSPMCSRLSPASRSLRRSAMSFFRTVFARAYEVMRSTDGNDSRRWTTISTRSSVFTMMALESARKAVRGSTIRPEAAHLVDGGAQGVDVALHLVDRSQHPLAGQVLVDGAEGAVVPGAAAHDPDQQ